MSSYIVEAFKALEDLDDNVYSTSREDLEKLSDVINDDVVDEIEIVDADAYNDDQVKDSYTGDIILQCPVCASNIFQNEDDVHYSEETDTVNDDMECPYCHSLGGFKILGKVCDCDHTEDAPEEKDGEEEVEETEEEITEGLFNKKEKKNDAPSDLPYTADELKQGIKKGIKGVKIDDIEYMKDKGTFGIDTRNKGCTFINPKQFTTVDAAVGELKKRFDESLNESKKLNESSSIDVLYDLVDRAKLIVDEGKSPEDAVREAIDDGLIYSDDIVSLGMRYGAIDTSGVIDRMYDELFDEIYSIVTKKDESLTEKKWSYTLKHGKALRDAIDSFDKKETVELLIDSYDELKKNSLIDESDYDEYTESLYGMMGDDADDIDEDDVDFELNNFYDLCDNLGVWVSLDEGCHGKKKNLKEDFKDVSITTDTEHMEMTSDENGKVTLTTEPVKEEVEEPVEEVVALTDEEKEEILTKDEEPTEEEPVEEEPTDEEESEDIDIDEVDEESFGELGESYFKRVYENVDSYKVSGIKTTKNGFLVEGILKFNTGNEKSTSFVFEANKKTRNGKLKFLGENKNIGKGYSVLGTVQDKKLMVESFNYDYKVDNTRIYGTVRGAK